MQNTKLESVSKLRALFEAKSSEFVTMPVILAKQRSINDSQSISLDLVTEKLQTSNEPTNVCWNDTAQVVPDSLEILYAKLNAKDVCESILRQLVESSMGISEQKSYMHSLDIVHNVIYYVFAQSEFELLIEKLTETAIETAINELRIEYRALPCQVENASDSAIDLPPLHDVDTSNEVVVSISDQSKTLKSDIKIENGIIKTNAECIEVENAFDSAIDLPQLHDVDMSNEVVISISDHSNTLKSEIYIENGIIKTSETTSTIIVLGICDSKDNTTEHVIEPSSEMIDHTDSTPSTKSDVSGAYYEIDVYYGCNENDELEALSFNSSQASLRAPSPDYAQAATLEVSCDDVNSNIESNFCPESSSIKKPGEVHIQTLQSTLDALKDMRHISQEIISPANSTSPVSVMSRESLHALNRRHKSNLSLHSQMLESKAEIQARPPASSSLNENIFLELDECLDQMNKDCADLDEILNRNEEQSALSSHSSTRFSLRPISMPPQTTLPSTFALIAPEEIAPDNSESTSLIQQHADSLNFPLSSSGNSKDRANQESLLNSHDLSSVGPETSESDSDLFDDGSKKQIGSSKALRMLGILPNKDLKKPVVIAASPRPKRSNSIKSIRKLGLKTLLHGIGKAIPPPISSPSLPISTSKALKTLGLVPSTTIKENHIRNMDRSNATNEQLSPPAMLNSDGSHNQSRPNLWPLKVQGETLSNSMSNYEPMIQRSPIRSTHDELHSTLPPSAKALKMLGIIGADNTSSRAESSAMTSPLFESSNPLNSEQFSSGRKSQAPNTKALKMLGIIQADQRKSPTTPTSSFVMPESPASLNTMDIIKNFRLSADGNGRASGESLVTIRSLSNPLNGGFLSVYQPALMMKKWKQRYFVLTFGRLYFFKSNDLNNTMIGDVVIDSETFVTISASFKGKHVLEISRKKDNLDNLLLMFLDEEDMLNWFRGIKSAITRDKYLHTSLPNPPSLMTAFPSPPRQSGDSNYGTSRFFGDEIYDNRLKTDVGRASSSTMHSPVSPKNHNYHTISDRQISEHSKASENSTDARISFSSAVAQMFDNELAALDLLKVMEQLKFDF